MSTAPVPIEIVHGTAADLRAVNALMAAAFDPRFGEAWTPSQCLGMLALPGVWFILARIDGEPVGFALVRAVLDESELLLLAIHPKQRRKGIGRALLRSALADARARGATMMHLEVRANNDAVALYRNEGFRKIGERRGYYRGNDDKIFDAHTFSKMFD